MANAEISPITEARPVVVLLAEDEVILRLSTAEDLRTTGFSVIEAASADEAWTVLSSGADVDILFTDVQMPGHIDGIELAQRARRLRPALKIIVTSGQAPEWRGVRSADLFVGKPFDFDRLVKLLTELVNT